MPQPKDSLTCQEAHIFLSNERYFPCGKPAVASVYSERDGRAYNMCEMCTDHSIRNRRMAHAGPPTPDNKDIT